MSDLIRRSDAIKAFEDVLDCDYPFISEETPRERIEAIPTADPKRGEWILCSERLPKESEQDNELGVLVTLGNGYSGIQFDWVRDGEHWYDWDGYVIAWMHLPKPYGERREP